MTMFSVFLFEGTAPLDVFGPIQVIGSLEKFYTVNYYSEKGGLVEIQPGLKVDTKPLSEVPADGVFLIPGGFGTRRDVQNQELIQQVREKALASRYVLTVCTGSALLAKTGLLDNLKATTNKKAFHWVTEQGPNVHWVQKARWVKDGMFYTSSGVSAGIDMILGFVSDTIGQVVAEKIAEGIEYCWNKNNEDDPFYAVSE